MSDYSKAYSELLKDPRWQKKRLEIFNRDEWTCQSCRKTDQTLHVHHLSYKSGKMPWEYEDHVFITLCEGCHKLEEGLKDDCLAMREYAKKANMLVIDLHEMMAAIAFIKIHSSADFNLFKELIKRSCHGPDKEMFYQFIRSAYDV